MVFYVLLTTIKLPESESKLKNQSSTFKLSLHQISTDVI